MPPPESAEPKGIPRELDTRLRHLSKLLKHLPDALPTNPPDDQTTYYFYLDPDDVNDEGVMYAFNRRLEVAFATHRLAGAKLLVDLEKFLRKNIKENGSSEARSHQTRWIERLVTAAQDSGAKIPPKRRVTSDDNSNADISKSLISRPKKIQKRAPFVDLTADDDEDLPVAAPAPLPRVASTSIATASLTKAPTTTKAPCDKIPSSRANSAPPLVLQQRTLFQFGAKKLTTAEAEAQRKRHAAEARDKMQAAARREEEKKTRAAERKKDLNRDRQQRFRDRKKASGDSVARKTKAVVLGAPKSTVASDVNVAEVSRPSGMKWKAERTGKKKGVIQKRHQRVNWYHPFLWLPITSIVPRVGWSPTMIVASLQRQNPRVYARLNKGTVQKWISKNRRDSWSTKTKKNVARRHTLAGTGRVGVLSPYPEIVAAIKTKLHDLRVSGACVGRLLTRSIIIAIIREKKPELLANFKTGVMLMVANNKTYNPKGSRQVDIHGRDEKRAYSLLVASTPTGKLLPFQQVWSGKTKGSLPHDFAAGIPAAKKHGFHFAFAQSKKRPVISDQIQLLGLEPDQKAILYIDVYPVHTGIEYRTVMLKEYPNIFLVYVPANSDIGLNRVYKHHIKQAYLDWKVEAHTEQLKNGLTQSKSSSQHLFLSSTPAGQDVITKWAWEKCTVGEFNLGAECLTSKKTKAAYRQYLLQHPDFCKEIEDKIGNVLGLDDEMVAAGAAIEAQEVAAMGADDVLTDETNTDPTDVPLDSVLHAALQLQLPAAQLPVGSNFCVPARTVHADDNGILAGGDDMENIWAYNDNGCPWSEGNLANETFGQP
ncbi:hypothetical protein C8R45DRAFT_942718 [Mycena sanguinolenta]|nr:hypothetical protein C8R45DRAFT_942718 [Mycena sanguinolenta]